MAQPVLALAWTAMVLFLLAQFYPVMTIRMEGLNHAAHIATGVTEMADQQFPSLGLLVLALAIAAPFMRISAVIWVLTCIRMRHMPTYLTRLFRISEILRPWAMLDVLLLGIFVSSSKLRSMADIETGTGFWALCCAVLAIFAMEAALDRRAIWDVLKPPPLFTAQPEPNTYSSCPTCEWLQPNDEADSCARCGASIHYRKPNSLSQTWALIIASLILYIPANTYPVLTTISLGQAKPSTIMEGVHQLFNGNDWPLAVILFTASIIIPLMKLIGFIWLMISIRQHSRAYLITRTRLFRFIFFIGRWSNTDIFVGALLVGLVTLGNIASVVPGIGGIAFGAVVILTMWAAETFDPRLIWDAAEKNHG